MNWIGKTGIVATLFLALAAGASSAHAASSKAPRSQAQSGSRTFGLGAVIGEPSGLSAKYWVNHKQALDFGLAYSFNHFMTFFSDFLFHFPGAFKSSTAFTAQLAPYVGIGGVLFVNTQTPNKNNSFFTGDGDNAGLGLRLPLGIEWTPADPPLGIFVELVPGLGIIPSTYGFFQAGIGIRYYF